MNEKITDCSIAFLATAAGSAQPETFQIMVVSSLTALICYLVKEIVALAKRK